MSDKKNDTSKDAQSTSKERPKTERPSMKTSLNKGETIKTSKKSDKYTS